MVKIPPSDLPNHQRPLLEDDLLSLSAAARILPRRRDGKKVHTATLYRWTTTGLKGVVARGSEPNIPPTEWKLLRPESLNDWFRKFVAEDAVGKSPAINVNPRK